MGNRVKVLYIAGFGRSGSTILGSILGQVEGFAYAGELVELWDVLATGRVVCGCGVPVVACNVWKDVLKEAYGGIRESPISQMLDFRYGSVPTRALLRTTTSSAVRIFQQRLAKPLVELEKLYRAIQRVFNCKVIVDSSKYPMYGYTLQLTEGIDLYVLHLIRDPRASAYSWFARNLTPGGLRWTGQLNPIASSLMWNYRNCTMELMSKRFRQRPLCLRYEDLVADPRGSLQRILSLVCEPCPVLPLEDEHSLNVNIQHTVYGNPNRFTTGKIQIREDHEWETQMKRRHKIPVTALTWPLLIKYGYPIRTLQVKDVASIALETTNRKSHSLEGLHR
jgi:hypothetical protein